MLQAAEPVAETGAEVELLCCGCLLLVKVVVTVWIEKAVPEYRRRDLHAIAEKGLQSASSPRIAAGLGGIGHAQSGIEAPGPLRKLSSDGQKAVGKQVNCIVFKAEGEGGEAGKDGDDPLLRDETLGAAAGGALRLALDGMQRFVVGDFTLLLFLRVEPRALKGGLNGTGVPVGDCVGDLIINPGPAVGSFHRDSVYANCHPGVPGAVSGLAIDGTRGGLRREKGEIWVKKAIPFLGSDP